MKDYSNVLTLDDIPRIENEIKSAIVEFCEENNIDNLRTECQNVFHAGLMHVRRRVFPVRDLLLDAAYSPTSRTIMDSTLNRFNYTLLSDIADIYVNICMINDKECSLYGFSLLTGVSYDRVREWLNGVNLSAESHDLAKKLANANEQSLQSKLTTVKNPVGVMAILNHNFLWSMPGVSREEVRPVSLPSSALPRLGGEIVAQMPDKSTPEAEENE